jgi:hypothetical protein
MSESETLKSVPNLITTALTQLSTLVRKEVDLARAEVTENVSNAGVAIGLIVAAVVIALTALNVLSAAVVAGLTELGIEPGWSALIVGGGLGLLAFALISKGTNDLKLSSLAPTRTANNIQRDAQAVKEAYDAK